MEKAKVLLLIPRDNVQLPAGDHGLEGLHAEIQLVLKPIRGEDGGLKVLSRSSPVGLPLSDSQVVPVSAAVASVTSPWGESPGIKVSVVNDISLQREEDS